MPAPQVFLQPYSNREDFLLTVGIYDDDTGNPVNLSGTLGAGTFNNWTVTDGAIATTSVTQLTIGPNTALALIVGVGLGIKAGDFITIADPSGLNQMFGYATSYNANNGALVVQVGWSFEFEIRQPRSGFDNSGYVPFYDIGTPGDTPILSATNGTGVSIVDTGIIQILIPEATFRQLHAHTYLCNLTGTDGVNTRQIFIGKLPVLYGGVTN